MYTLNFIIYNKTTLQHNSDKTFMLHSFIHVMHEDHRNEQSTRPFDNGIVIRV